MNPNFVVSGAEPEDLAPLDTLGRIAACIGITLVLAALFGLAMQL